MVVQNLTPEYATLGSKADFYTSRNGDLHLNLLIAVQMSIIRMSTYYYVYFFYVILLISIYAYHCFELVIVNMRSYHISLH